MKMLLLLLSLFLCMPAFATEEDFAKVQPFISAMKADDRARLAKLVNYPIHMRYPIPSIKNEKDFIDMYGLIFDEALEKLVINSKAGDWATVGWRGIMLNHGTLWFTEEGYLRSSNYFTQSEATLHEKLRAKEKAYIHSSLNKYSGTALVMKTESFTIRIDWLDEDTLRYASWEKGRPMSSKPSLILFNGTSETQGTMRNTIYTFVNGKYTYECMSGGLGMLLVIYKDGEEILSQESVYDGEEALRQEVDW